MQRKTGVAMRSWAGVIHAACPQRVKRVDRAVSAIGPVTLRSPTKRFDESIVEKGHNQTKNGARHLCYWAPALTTHSNSEKLRNACRERLKLSGLNSARIDRLIDFFAAVETV